VKRYTERPRTAYEHAREIRQGLRPLRDPDAPELDDDALD
jgi:hypothetical protein